MSQTIWCMCFGFGRSVTKILIIIKQMQRNLWGNSRHDRLKTTFRWEAKDQKKTTVERVKGTGERHTFWPKIEILLIYQLLLERDQQIYALLPHIQMTDRQTGQTNSQFIKALSLKFTTKTVTVQRPNITHWHFVTTPLQDCWLVGAFGQCWLRHGISFGIDCFFVNQMSWWCYILVMLLLLLLQVLDHSDMINDFLNWDHYNLIRIGLLWIKHFYTTNIFRNKL